MYSNLIMELADGSTKSSSQIVIGDYLLNNFKQPCLVTDILTTNTTSYSITLSSTPSFYISPNQPLRTHITTNGNKIYKWDTINNIHTNNSCIINNKYFFVGCGKHITNYTQDNTTRTLYNFVLHNCDNFYANNVIFKTEE